MIPDRTYVAEAIIYNNDYNFVLHLASDTKYPEERIGIFKDHLIIDDIYYDVSSVDIHRHMYYNKHIYHFESTHNSHVLKKGTLVVSQTHGVATGRRGKITTVMRIEKEEVNVYSKTFKFYFYPTNIE